MGEPGASETNTSRNPEISEARVRLFIQSLPPEGIILHGTSIKAVDSIKRLGLKAIGGFGPPPQTSKNAEKLAALYQWNIKGISIAMCYFFLKISNDSDRYMRDPNVSEYEYSSHEEASLIRDLRVTVEECMMYANNFKLSDDGRKTAIVVARKPSKGLLLGGGHKAFYERHNNLLPMGRTPLTIPSKDILAIVTPDGDISSKREQVEDVLQKILTSVINKSQANPKRS